MTGEALAEIARSWVGVRYVHNQASKAIGCDCAGLIIGAAREAGLTSTALPRYGRDVPPAELLAHLRGELEPVWYDATPKEFGGPDIEEGWAEAQPGDVICFALAAPHGKPFPRHLGIWCGGSVVHVVDEKGCVETPLDTRWKRRLHSVWRWRKLTDG